MKKKVKLKKKSGKKFKNFLEERRKKRLREILAPANAKVITPMIARNSVRLLGDALGIIEHVANNCFDKLDMVSLPEPTKEAFLRSISILKEAVSDSKDKQRDMLAVLDTVAKTIREKYEYISLG